MSAIYSKLNKGAVTHRSASHDKAVTVPFSRYLIGRFQPYFWFIKQLVDEVKNIFE